MKLKPRIPSRVARRVRLGARVSIVDGPDGRAGRSGVLIAETKKMLWLKAEDNRKIIKVPKEQVVIMLEGGYVVSGRALIGDPAERLVRSYER